MHAGKNVRGIALNTHPAAASVALLATPEFPVEECLVDRHPGRYTAKGGHQGFTVGFACCLKAQHRILDCKGCGAPAQSSNSESRPAINFCALRALIHGRLGLEC